MFNPTHLDAQATTLEESVVTLEHMDMEATRETVKTGLSEEALRHCLADGDQKQLQERPAIWRGHLRNLKTIREVFRQSLAYKVAHHAATDATIATLSDRLVRFLSKRFDKIKASPHGCWPTREFQCYRPQERQTLSVSWSEGQEVTLTRSTWAAFSPCQIRITSRPTTATNWVWSRSSSRQWAIAPNGDPRKTVSRESPNHVNARNSGWSSIHVGSSIVTKRFGKPTNSGRPAQKRPYSWKVHLEGVDSSFAGGFIPSRLRRCGPQRPKGAVEAERSDTPSACGGDVHCDSGATSGEDREQTIDPRNAPCSRAGSAWW